MAGCFDFAQQDAAVFGALCKLTFAGRTHRFYCEAMCVK